MLKLFYGLSELNFGKLMSVYEESNRKNARERYRRMDPNAGLLQAEQDFYAYLRDVFFSTENVCYAVWEENSSYISAFRLEPYADGFLLAALETSPMYRGKGYAKQLIQTALRDIKAPVYSHVHKQNTASLRTHLACGFAKISEQARYLDGTVSDQACTLLRKPSEA